MNGFYNSMDESNDFEGKKIVHASIYINHENRQNKTCCLKVHTAAGGTEKSKEVVTVKVRTLVMRERERGRLKGDDHVLL